MRKYRKREHIENYLRTTFVGDTLLGDVYLYNNSLPEIDFSQIDTSVLFLNKRINFPLMINAMTGGTDFSKDLNEDLAKLASEFNIPMAVGSQSICFDDPQTSKSFEVVRENIENGIVLSNLSARASLANARTAVNMISADGLQLHLNVAHELAMSEGERNFTNILLNISRIVEGVDVPVIVKEVGFGLSESSVKKLYDIGVRNVDISGFGGTNFIEIENLRSPENDLSEIYGWGIPTAVCIYEANKLNLKDLFIIASGGIKNSLDLVKSIVLGASMGAISGELLSFLVHGGYDYSTKYISNLIYKTKILMLLTGSKNIDELKKAKYKLCGKLKELVI